MPSINLEDLDNAKLDVAHIAALATSEALVAVDRKGRAKKTWQGIIQELGAEYAVTETAQNRQAAAESAQAAVAAVAALAADDGAMLVGGVTPIYVLKDFHKAGGSDSSVINRALRKIELDALPGSRLIFEQGRTYTYDSTGALRYINDLEIDLNGALLMRADSPVTSATLAQELVTSGSAGLNLYLTSIPANWAVDDTIFANTGLSNAQSSTITRITAINRGTGKVTVNGVLGGYTGASSYPAGTTIAKSFNCFAGRPSLGESTTPLTAGANKRIRIHGGTIDGNSVNQPSNSWRFNAEILLHSEGGQIHDCEIRNTAAEAIVGHGIAVHGNLFKDLGGSALHTSANDATVAVITPSFFVRNIVRRTNLKGQIASGHSEGAVTFSWGPGQLVVSSNFFEDGGESVLGAFGVSTGANASRLLIVSNNICKNFKSIFYAANASTYGVNICNNDFHDCGDNSALTALFSASGNRVKNNSVSGNTVLFDSIERGRMGPQVFEKVGGEASDIVMGNDTRVWVRQSAAPSVNPLQHYEAGLVMESAGNNVISWATGPTKFAGHQFHIAGTPTVVAYALVDNAANKMIFGTNRAGGAITLKTNNYSDHLSLLASGDTVFHKTNSAVYVGDPNTDGSWHFAISGADLVWRRRVGGAWIVKQTISGA